MPQPVKIQFVALDSLSPEKAGAGASGAPIRTLAIFAAPDLALGEKTRALVGPEVEALIARAAATAKFKGRTASALDILAPAGLAAERLLVIGSSGAPDEQRRRRARRQIGAGARSAGRKAQARRRRPTTPILAASPPARSPARSRGAAATIVFDLPTPPLDARRGRRPISRSACACATIASTATRPARRRGGRKRRGRDRDRRRRPHGRRGGGHEREATALGVIAARTLVNEPANVLFPEEFANRAKELEKLGVEVEILDEAAMRGLGMGALLGVSQGSSREGRLVIMRWRGAPAGADEKPVAFVGKGVTFDTGGISIKPAGGMEDMKGDMAGAACVTGLIETLARRRARVDAIGAIGLVENMPGPDAQRPGDIVTSMSGQTIEIINTDAEGRLVLADVLWYVQDRFKPRFIVDLATLTGAILVALGQDHAGLFSNDDDLSEKLIAAGRETGEKLWRMPLGPAYDKLIDSKFADMKNTGGRHAGSITAAQFLQRYVNGTPWAHLDIAGTGMGSPIGDVNQSWGSGFGVRLLDRLVADNYEG